MNFLKRFQQPPSQPQNQILGGRYKVIDQLGAGGFSQTFLAEDLHLPGHPACVVKQLKPQLSDPSHLQTARRLFNTEAKVLYQLGSHDQIPRLLAHFEDGEEFYLVQELIEGEPLAKYLKPGQPWPQEKAIALLRDILRVLVFVHQQQVIHRDIKPSNLICRKDGKIVLIDFGAVKEVSTQLAEPQTKQTLTISIGTQGYTPVEQLSGVPRFNSDIYAVGMVGIQALTGMHPKQFDLNPQTGEIDWHRLDSLSFDPQLVAILDRMVCYHFRERYQTANEALHDLDELAQQRNWGDSYLEEEPVTLLPRLESEEIVTTSESVGSSSAPVSVAMTPPRKSDKAVAKEAELFEAHLLPTVCSPNIQVPQPSLEPSLQESDDSSYEEVTLSSSQPLLHQPQSLSAEPQPAAISTNSANTSSANSANTNSANSTPAAAIDPVPPPPTTFPATELKATAVSSQSARAETVRATEVYPTARLAPPQPFFKTAITNLLRPAMPSRSPFALPGVRLGLLLLVGVGVFSAATIAVVSNLVDPNSRSAMAPSALPDLPCQESPLPTLSDDEPDYEYPDGARYYGPLENGMPSQNGKVTIVFPSGNRYDGELRDGRRNGCGTLSFSNGRRYVGQFKDDQFNGLGIWTLENGDRYIGTFQNNRCHGEGIFVFKDGTSKRGVWRDGDLVNGNLSCNRID